MTTRIVHRETVYAGWLSLERLEIALPNGAVEERHVEDHGAAVALLPYDPVRRTAILVSQPRVPVLLAGKADLLEAVAGRLEPEGPDRTARKEAHEEAGLSLRHIEEIAHVWDGAQLVPTTVWTNSRGDYGQYRRRIFAQLN